jgi:hypothetical protein
MTVSVALTLFYHALRARYTPFLSVVFSYYSFSTLHTIFLCLRVTFSFLFHSTFSTRSSHTPRSSSLAFVPFLFLLLFFFPLHTMLRVILVTPCPSRSSIVSAPRLFFFQPFFDVLNAAIMLRGGMLSCCSITLFRPLPRKSRSLFARVDHHPFMLHHHTFLPRSSHESLS